MAILSWNRVFLLVQAAQGVSNMVVPSWSHVFSRPELEPRVFTCPGRTRGYLTWCSRAGTTYFYMSRPPSGVSNMWSSGRPQTGGRHKSQTKSITRHHMCNNLTVSSPGDFPDFPLGYLAWWSRAGTTCFRVSRLPREGVSNLVVPSWNHGFLRVQAAQGVSNMVVPSWNHVFSRVQATSEGV